MSTWRMSGSQAASACEISAGMVRGRCALDALSVRDVYVHRLSDDSFFFVGGSV
jgi:hypothetical protein